MKADESAALQAAVTVLAIEDVCVRRLSAVLEPGFEPSYDSDLDKLIVAMKHQVKRFEVIALDNAEEHSIQRYRVFIDLGVRWSRPPHEEAADVEDDSGVGYSRALSDDLDAVATIEAEMMAEYAMSEDPGGEALDVFARRNASYHVWPYWRELVSSQCLRMNLPKVTLPIRQFAMNADQAADR